MRLKKPLDCDKPRIGTEGMVGKVGTEEYDIERDGGKNVACGDCSVHLWQAGM